MIKMLDCTLRDGGYYNSWDFSEDLIADYLTAMDTLSVDFVEIGFRSLKNNDFKGGCAYSTESFLQTMKIPSGLKDKLGVMVNGSELLNDRSVEGTLEKLFPPLKKSLIKLVRIACHYHEFAGCIDAAAWLKKNGFIVGFNLMQIADRTEDEIISLARLANEHDIDVLYFADSMGSLKPDDVKKIVLALREGWKGDLGIHTHDNMGCAIINTLSAIDLGVTWVDSTVMGMGRGPGNAKTENLVIELQEARNKPANLTKILELVREHFEPLQNKYKWGTNSYYYLAGKYGIHPSYIQNMLNDNRYNEEDILSVIDCLKERGGKKYEYSELKIARTSIFNSSEGSWLPITEIRDREVMIVAPGPSVIKHSVAIESYIRKKNPYVIALNAQSSIDESLINVRAACHPVRLLADLHEHQKLPQRIIMPALSVPDEILSTLELKETLDFGLSIRDSTFEFHESSCVVPNLLVLAYALSVATSGKAQKILLAGFDGYSADDERRKEIDSVFECYARSSGSIKLISITPTRYEIPTCSIYGLVD